MLIVFLLIGVGIALWGRGDVARVMGGVFAGLALVIALAFTGYSIDGRNINDRIAVQQGQIKKIETLAKEIAEISDNPEILSPYTRAYLIHNAEIERLKNRVIDIRNYRWWVYFG